MGGIQTFIITLTKNKTLGQMGQGIPVKQFHSWTNHTKWNKFSPSSLRRCRATELATEPFLEPCYVRLEATYSREVDSLTFAQLARSQAPINWGLLEPILWNITCKNTFVFVMNSWLWYSLVAIYLYFRGNCANNGFIGFFLVQAKHE